MGSFLCASGALWVESAALGQRTRSGSLQWSREPWNVTRHHASTGARPETVAVICSAQPPDSTRLRHELELEHERKLELELELEHERKLELELEQEEYAMAKAAPILALIAGGVALFGLLGANLDIVSPVTGLMTFVAGALLGGLLTILVSLVAIFLARGGRNPDGLRMALATLTVGLGLMLIVFAAGSPGRGLPAINDITTDLDNPPAFAPATVVPAYVGRNMEYPAEFVEQVRLAYSDLQPIRLSSAPRQSFEKALATAERLGWTISANSPQQLVFDAEHQTRLFHFVDDVTVRVVADGADSRVDVRSKSRDGRGDLGANAARIRRFSQALQ